MEAVLLVIHLLIALAIIIVVLIQPSEAGGFLGNSGSMSNIGMPRRGGDVLTRLTTILAACFFSTSLLLAIFAGQRGEAKGVLDLANEVAAPDTVIEKMVDEKTGDAAPAAAVTKEEKTETTTPEKPKAPIAK